MLAPDEAICKHCGKVIYIEIGAPWTHEKVGRCSIAEPVEKPLVPVKLSDFNHPLISQRQRDWLKHLVDTIEDQNKIIEGYQKNMPVCGACAEVICCGNTMNTHDETCPLEKEKVYRIAIKQLVQNWIWYLDNPKAPVMGKAKMDDAVHKCIDTLKL